MSSTAELQQALIQSNQQLAALGEISVNKKTYDQKGDQLEGVIHPNNETSEPETPYDAKYPYNNSMTTESGHVMEFDDTPGAERVSTAHRTGTFFEVHPDGSKMEKIVNDNVQIIVKDNEIYIMGNEKKSTQGNLKLFIRGNAKLQVNGDVELEVGGNMTMKVDGAFTAMAESFNFVGPINHVGDLNCTGNIINQGNISSAKNIQAELDFVGHQDLLIDRNSHIGGLEEVVGNITTDANLFVAQNISGGTAGGGSTMTVNGSASFTGDVVANGISLDTHKHSDPQGGNTGPPSA
jgi:hypothetical protein